MKNRISPCPINRIDRIENELSTTYHKIDDDRFF